jgi:hypothetical protein
VNRAINHLHQRPIVRSTTRHAAPLCQAVAWVRTIVGPSDWLLVVVANSSFFHPDVTLQMVVRLADDHGDPG